jgi:hypothetical protein
MFVGRFVHDGRFENKVGLDIFLILCRKPLWDWSQEVEQAEGAIRLVASKVAAGSSSSNEYYPNDGQSAYYLHPDALFSQDWLERAANVGPDKGMLGGGGRFQAGGGGADFGFAAIAPPPDFYTGSLPGFVFCATPAVIEEMFGRFLLGLPPQMQDVVIHPNVPLFIFDTQAQVLLGIFHADSPTALNIDPSAFVDWAGVNPAAGPSGMVSALPVQLKFRIAMEAAPIPVHDPELQTALGKQLKALGGPLAAAETRNIANLFARRAFAVTMQASGGGRGGPVRPMNAAPGNGAYYKPPFKYVSTVLIDLPGSSYDIKRRVLGANASIIMGIVDSLGSKHSIRVRMRGLGSGFTEGPTNTELPEPLHFNVSAESEALLQSVTVQVQALVDRNRM